MGEGTIRTCGSSMFLKEKFGVGYTLNIFKSDVNDTNYKPIIDLLKSTIPKCKHEPNVSTDLSFKLPTDSSNKFSSLFKQLESRKD